MRPGSLLTVTRAALLACIFASTALIIDYEKPGDPAFCARESACMQVRRSDVGLAISDWIYENISKSLTLPHVALFLFLSVMAVSFFLKLKLHVYVVAAMCSIGAAFAAYLIWAQISIDALCAYCMVVDSSTIVAAAASIALAVKTARLPGGVFAELEEPSLRRGTDTATTLAWGVAGTIVVGIPYLFAQYPPVPSSPPLPPAFEALKEPGKTLVVTFTDFQCPHCRRLHMDTKERLHQPDVTFHRFMVPLAFHTGARPAAEGYLCAPEDKREDVANDLYGASAEELTYEGVIGILTRHGASEENIFECMRAPATKEKIQADMALFDAVGAQGLPTTWVDATMVVGSRGDVVVSLLERSGGPPALQLPVWLMFVFGAIVIGGVAVWSEIRRSPDERAVTHPPPEPVDSAETDGEEPAGEEPPAEAAEDEEKIDDEAPAKAASRKKRRAKHK